MHQTTRQSSVTCEARHTALQSSVHWCAFRRLPRRACNPGSMLEGRAPEAEVRWSALLSVHPRRQNGLKAAQFAEQIKPHFKLQTHATSHRSSRTASHHSNVQAQGTLVQRNIRAYSPQSPPKWCPRRTQSVRDNEAYQQQSNTPPFSFWLSGEWLSKKGCTLPSLTSNTAQPHQNTNHCRGEKKQRKLVFRPMIFPVPIRLVSKGHTGHLLYEKNVSKGTTTDHRPQWHFQNTLLSGIRARYHMR